MTTERKTARRVLVWRDGRVHVDPGHDEVASAVHDPQALVWVDLEGDPAGYAHDLEKVFAISPLMLHMLQEPRERAKFVAENGRYYLCLHGLRFDPKTGLGETPKIDIIFGRTVLVTAHLATMPWLTALREQTANDASLVMGRGIAFLLHAVVDALVDSYFPVLDDIDDQIDELENTTVTNTSEAVQGRIFRIKRSLAQLRRVISPQVELINSLSTRTDDLIPEAAHPYFVDVHDHVVRAFEVLDSYRDLMSGLLDVYLATVSNRLNVVMKQLTIYAAIFFPITFITGVFGQNFGHMPQVEHDAGWNFWIVLAGIALITAAHLVYFRLKKWM